MIAVGSDHGSIVTEQEAVVVLPLLSVMTMEAVSSEDESIVPNVTVLFATLDPDSESVTIIALTTIATLAKVAPFCAAMEDCRKSLNYFLIV